MESLSFQMLNGSDDSADFKNHVKVRIKRQFLRFDSCFHSGCWFFYFLERRRNFKVLYERTIFRAKKGYTFAEEGFRYLESFSKFNQTIRNYQLLLIGGQHARLIHEGSGGKRWIIPYDYRKWFL